MKLIIPTVQRNKNTIGEESILNTTTAYRSLFDLRHNLQNVKNATGKREVIILT